MNRAPSVETRVSRAGWLLLGACSIVLAFAVGPAVAAAQAEVQLRPETLALINQFLTTITPPLSSARLVQADVPTLGCRQDGQLGPQDAPRLPKSLRVVVPEGFESSLAFYSAREGIEEGVLAPRGWACFGTYGSDGTMLYVVPRRRGAMLVDQPEKVIDGPIVIKSVTTGGTSGRFAVAKVSARIFPRAHAFVESVRREGIDDPKDYVFAPWPSDQIDRLSDLAVSYVTPPHAQGLGTAIGALPAGEPIFGLAVLMGHLEGKGDGPNLRGLAIRLDEPERQLYAGIVVAQIASMVTLPGEERRETAQESSPSELTPPYQLTSRGNMAQFATLEYKDAIESCYPGTPGSIPSGPRFVACLRQQIRREAASLDAAYGATIGFLRSAPDKISKLRQAQRAWLEFQATNCAFAQAVAPQPEAEEFFLDCELRSTIDRRVELRSLVGD